MPSIRHLDRIRSPGAGTLGIGSGPVSADHLDARVFAEPGGEGFGLPVVQHIDGPVGVHVDQNSGIRLAATFSPIVNSQHSDLPELGIGQSTDQPDQGVSGRRDAQAAEQSGPGPACQRERKALKQIAQH